MAGSAERRVEDEQLQPDGSSAADVAVPMEAGMADSAARSVADGSVASPVPGAVAPMEVQKVDSAAAARSVADGSAALPVPGVAAPMEAQKVDSAAAVRSADPVAPGAAVPMECRKGAALLAETALAQELHGRAGQAAAHLGLLLADYPGAEPLLRAQHYRKRAAEQACS